MNTSSLKITLIQWLSAMDDKNLLQSLMYYKTMQENADWYEALSDEQRASMSRGLADVKAGRTVSNKKVWERYGRKAKS